MDQKKIWKTEEKSAMSPKICRQCLLGDMIMGHQSLKSSREDTFCSFWKESPSFLTTAHPDLNLFNELQVPEKKQPWESEDNLATRNVQEGHYRSPHRTWMGERGYPCENFKKFLYIMGICELLHLFWSGTGRKCNAGLFCLSP